MTTRTGSLALLLALVAGRVAAQDPQLDLNGKQAANVARGFSPEKAYQVGDVDHVNLFNGNLNVGIPLGPSLPIGPGLDLQLTLTYNSHPWDFEQIGSEAEVVPARGMNSGLGWRLSLGELLHPEDVNNPTNGQWLYIDPSGAQHVFYRKLHASETAITNVFYSRDSTYLRLQRVTVAGVTELRLELPDGTVQRFREVTTDSPPTDTPKYRLVEVKDAYGNGYTVTYRGPNTTVDPLRHWEISQIGNSARRMRVFFDETVAKAGLYYQSRGGVVSRVEMPKVGGTATWSFTYQVLTSEAPCGNTAGETQRENVPLLTQVTQPDGATWEMRDPLPALGLGYITDGPNFCSPSAGLLTRMRLPTKGLLEWDWATYKFPADQASNCRDFLNLPAGVAARRRGPRNPSAPGASWDQWLYEQKYPPGGSGWNCRTGGMPAQYSVTTVKTPLGPRTESYFSVSFGANGWDAAEYGFPISHHEESGAGWGASTKTYSAASGGTLLRSSYVRYEWDGGGADHVNQRLAGQKTVYHDDGNREATVVSSKFDGVGHYRKTLTGGTFDSGNVRGTETAYDGVYADFPHLGGGSSGEVWPAASPWVWTTYGSAKAWEGASDPPTSALVEQFCFDRSTGFLKRHRVLAGSASATNDLLQVFTGTGGFVTREQDYGGDTQAIATTADLCALTLPTPEAYRIDHTYAYAALQTSAYVRANGSEMPFKSVERTIDAATGLATASTEPDGRSTSLSYDALGRPTFIKPQDGLSAWTQYTYNPATYNSQTLAGTQASVGVLRRANGATSGPSLAASGITFDDLGRVYRESFTQPDGTSSVRETLYNANGWKQSVSELNTTGQAAGKTQYLSYDAFGRPTAITPPDGSAHGIVLTYTGDRLVSRRVKVGTSRTLAGVIVETDATTTETYDRQGRLIAVTEPLVGGLTTSYGYDFGGRLASVVSGAQSRSFVYDGRGLLLSETHPEKGASGYGTVSYSQYDARGRVGKKVDGDVQLLFAYDRAERLLSVTDAAPNPDRLLKELTYDAASGSTYPKSKLTSAVRHNWVRPVQAAPGTAPVDTTVTESLTYSAPNGAISERLTTVSTGASFRQSFTYTALGDPASLTYPRCEHASCAPTAGAARIVDLTYTQGRLTAVTQSLPSPLTLAALTYHPNGMVATVTHGNGVTDTTDNDPNQMRRPLNIRTSATTAVLGPYKFDGAGNLTDIGGEQMLYDGASRLVDFKFSSGQRQQFTYDRWGSLTQIKTTVGGSTTTQDFAMSGTTNRLSSAGYDKAGNLTGWGSYSYGFDAFNQMVNLDGGGNDETYYYTPSDERLVAIHYNPALGYPAGKTATYRLRDLAGQVLTEYTLAGSDVVGHWAWSRDTVYRGGLLLAAISPATTWHYTLDHLGTPRLLTNPSGTYVSDHHYYPYGQELNPQTSDPMKFTGHERDFNQAGTTDDLDYMHARSCSPVTGRFLSVDPAMESADPYMPQTWNRYNYVAGNPLKYVDPTGEVLFFFGQRAELEQLKKLVNDTLHGYDLQIDKNGKASLVANQEAGPPSPEQQAFADTLSKAINEPGAVNLSVVSGASDVIFGQYISGQVDISDIGGIGDGRGVSAAAVLAHEIAEQTQKQTLGLPSDKTGFAVAHPFGVAAQEAVSGYRRVSTFDTLNAQNTGQLGGSHQRGRDTVTVTFQFVNGNLVKTTRRP